MGQPQVLTAVGLRVARPERNQPDNLIAELERYRNNGQEPRLADGAQVHPCVFQPPHLCVVHHDTGAPLHLYPDQDAVVHIGRCPHGELGNIDRPGNELVGYCSSCLVDSNHVEPVEGDEFCERDRHGLIGIFNVQRRADDAVNFGQHLPFKRLFGHSRMQFGVSDRSGHLRADALEKCQVPVLVSVRLARAYGYGADQLALGKERDIYKTLHALAYERVYFTFFFRYTNRLGRRSNHPARLESRDFVDSLVPLSNGPRGHSWHIGSGYMGNGHVVRARLNKCNHDQVERYEPGDHLGEPFVDVVNVQRRAHYPARFGQR